MRWHIHVAHVRVLGLLAVHPWDDTGRHATGRGHGRQTIVGRRRVQGRCGLRVFLSVRTSGSARGRCPRSEGCGRSCSRFLNSACVVVLMARQGSATRERLLAVRVGTLVRALARVDASVAREGARVAEGLGQN